PRGGAGEGGGARIRWSARRSVEEAAANPVVGEAGQPMRRPTRAGSQSGAAREASLRATLAEAAPSSSSSAAGVLSQQRLPRRRQRPPRPRSRSPSCSPHPSPSSSSSPPPPRRWPPAPTSGGATATGTTAATGSDERWGDSDGDDSGRWLRRFGGEE
ncbi:Os02g0828300, partial [Oryza sativa Japonica Group]